MPLPIRPLSEPSGGEPPQSKRTSPAATDDGSLALPALDFDSFGAAESEDALPGLPPLEPVAEKRATAPVPTKASVEDVMPEFSFEESEATPVSELSDDEFDDLFNDFEDNESTAIEAEPIPAPPPPPAPPAPAALPQELDDMDFDALFNEDDDSSENSAALPIPPVEDDDDDDWDAHFEEPEDSLPAPASDDSLGEDPFEDEEPQALPLPPQDEAEDSWEAEFDKFMEEEGEESAEPEAEEPSEEEEEVPDDALAPLKKGGKKKPKAKGKGKRGGKAPNPILRNLAAIPILGLLFKPLLMLGSFGVFILGLLPLIAVPVVIFLIASNSVPGGNTVTGPDSSEASISDFSFTDGKANGTVTNSGEVIADVTANFTVWSYNPLGGGSIFAFDEVGSCTSAEVSVDIDASTPVSAACEVSSSGLFTKVSGTLSY